MEEDYTAMLGKAVYAFAYYEWTIIYIIEYLEKGYLAEYCRGKPQTSGDVLNKFKEILKPSADETIQGCCDDFSRLLVERNALIHAHPCTSPVDGKQVLNYQTQVSKLIHDKLWTIEEIKEFHCQVECAEAKAASVLDALRPTHCEAPGNQAKSEKPRLS
jgi:hypothetical protein